MTNVPGEKKTNKLLKVLKKKKKNLRAAGWTPEFLNPTICPLGSGKNRSWRENSYTTSILPRSSPQLCSILYPAYVMIPSWGWLQHKERTSVSSSSRHVESGDIKWETVSRAASLRQGELYHGKESFISMESLRLQNIGLATIPRDPSNKWIRIIRACYLHTQSCSKVLRKAFRA